MGLALNGNNSNNSTNNNGGNGNFEKATGFINVWVRNKNGTRRKLTGIPLREGRASEKALIERLQKDPEAIEALLNALELDYQPAEGDSDSAFDF